MQAACRPRLKEVLFGTLPHRIAQDGAARGLWGRGDGGPAHGGGRRVVRRLAHRPRPRPDHAPRTLDSRALLAGLFDRGFPADPFAR
jgi:hypothetical protein